MAEDREDKSANDRSREEERWAPSEDELNEILEKHQEWVETKTDEGERANLEGAHLKEVNLEGVHLGEVRLFGPIRDGANLESIYLEKAILTDTNLGRTNLKGAYLKKANLKGAYLKKANLKGTYLKKANLKGACLKEANLEGARLEEANLTAARLEEANLADANLQGVIGVQARQFRGVNVSNAKLPEDIARFDGLSIVKEASQSARKLFISVLVACAYSAITVATKGAGGDEVTLPIIDVNIGVSAFYLVTGVLLALLFGYFHLQMQRLWEEIAELPAIFPDGRPLDRKIHPWVVTGIVRAHVKHLKEQPSPPFFLLQRGVVVLLAWGLVPLALWYFAFMYSLHYGRWGSAFLFILAALTTNWAIASYRKATHTLKLKAHRPLRFRKPDSPEEEKWVLKSPSFWISVGLLLLAGAAWLVQYGLS